MSNIREAARKYALKYANNSLSYFGFLNGAQSEAAKELHQAWMYSEGEVLGFIMQAYTLGCEIGGEIDIVEWFNENKEKQKNAV